MMDLFELKQAGSSAVGGNPALPNYRFSIGTDENGKEWLCQIHPTNEMKHLLWNVDFDTNEEYWKPAHPNSDSEDGEDLSSPFLRPEALYCDWSEWAVMQEKMYHRKKVEYINIRKTIETFIKEKGLR